MFIQPSCYHLIYFCIFSYIFLRCIFHICLYNFSCASYSTSKYMICPKVSQKYSILLPKTNFLFEIVSQKSILENENAVFTRATVTYDSQKQFPKTPFQKNSMSQCTLIYPLSCAFSYSLPHF